MLFVYYKNKNVLETIFIFILIFPYSIGQVIKKSTDAQYNKS